MYWNNVVIAGVSTCCRCHCGLPISARDALNHQKRRQEMNRNKSGNSWRFVVYIKGQITRRTLLKRQQTGMIVWDPLACSMNTLRNGQMHKYVIPCFASRTTSKRRYDNTTMRNMVNINFISLAAINRTMNAHDPCDTSLCLRQLLINTYKIS